MVLFSRRMKIRYLITAAAVLSTCHGSVDKEDFRKLYQSKSDNNGDIRKLQTVGNIEVPSTFKPGLVKNAVTDLVACEANEYDFLTGMITGSSAVYTFDVTVAGTYQVSYGLVGFPATGLESKLVMSLLQGRHTCPPVGTDGYVGVEAFTTGSWTTVVNYVGTPITLAAGLNQEYTLCFERAAFVNLNYICIGTKCATKSSIDASALLAPVVIPTPVIEDVCIQWYVPISVKQDTCIQVLCMPEYVSLGTPFHVVVRFCNTHSRKWQLGLSLMDDLTKLYIDDIGVGTVYNSNMALMPLTSAATDPVVQPETPANGPDGTECGEYTFEITLDPAKVDKTAVLIWKFHLKPMWYNGVEETVDIFPNLIGDSEVYKQPFILPQDEAGILGDCPVIPRRNFVNPVVEPQDMIRFTTVPACLTPGKAWAGTAELHVESLDLVDVRVNLQIGSGPYLYLGVQDIFVAESITLEVAQNTAKTFWTPLTFKYSAAATAVIQPEDKIYLVVFMVNSGDYFDVNTGGWTIVDREYNLLIEQCPVG